MLEALNTHLACDAINVAMREIFKQMVYGRTQTAFSENGLPIGASLEDLGKGLCSQCGSVFSTLEKGPRMLQMAEGYVLELGKISMHGPASQLVRDERLIEAYLGNKK